MTRFGLELVRERAAVAVRDEGLRPFARRSGVAVGVVRSLLDNRDTSFSNTLAVANALGIDFHVGKSAATSPVEHITIDSADYTRIPLHEAYLSAGPGATNGEVAIIEHLAFRQEWLERVGVSAANAALARISGDSMAPGIQPGDIVLIDKSRQDIPVKKRLKRGAPPPIYAFIQDNEARVKRIERPEANLLVLMSDNPAYPPELVIAPLPEDLIILGQVVWSGHVWK